MNWPRCAIHHQISSPVWLRYHISQSAAIRTERQRVVHNPLNRDFRLAVHQKNPLPGSAGCVRESLPIRAEGEGNAQRIERFSPLPVDDMEPTVSRAPVVGGVCKAPAIGTKPRPLQSNPVKKLTGLPIHDSSHFLPQPGMFQITHAASIRAEHGRLKSGNHIATSLGLRNSVNDRDESPSLPGQIGVAFAVVAEDEGVRHDLIEFRTFPFVDDEE